VKMIKQRGGKIESKRGQIETQFKSPRITVEKSNQGILRGKPSQGGKELEGDDFLWHTVTGGGRKRVRGLGAKRGGWGGSRRITPRNRVCPVRKCAERPFTALRPPSLNQADVGGLSRTTTGSSGFTSKSRGTASSQIMTSRACEESNLNGAGHHDRKSARSRSYKDTGRWRPDLPQRTSPIIRKTSWLHERHVLRGETNVTWKYGHLKNRSLRDLLGTQLPKETRRRIVQRKGVGVINPHLRYQPERNAKLYTFQDGDAGQVAVPTSYRWPRSLRREKLGQNPNVKSGARTRR